MSQPDQSVVQTAVTAIQKEMEAEVQAIYRDASMKKYRRVFLAGYDACLRDNKLGKYAEAKP